MTADVRAPKHGRPISETIGFAISAVAIYGMTWQRALHGTDWRWFVLWLDEPGAVHPQHPGYLLLAHCVRWLSAPFGFDAFGALGVLSVLGGALAVAGCHRAFGAVLRDRLFVRMATLVVLFSPALWHHATVVELHAPFLGIMAWAMWAAARWCRSGGLLWAAVTGGLTGLATLVHATGHLGVGLIAAAFVWRRRSVGWVRVLAPLATFGVVHGAVWGCAFVAIRACGHLPQSVASAGAMGGPVNPLDYLVSWWQGMDFFTQLLPTVWNEWLLPFAPVSVLVLGALAMPRWRMAGVLFLSTLAVYVVATVALVHAWTDERGAYLLPLLVPGVALGCAMLPRGYWQALAFVTLLCGWTLRGEPGRLPPDHEFGGAAFAMAIERPTVFFVADFPEMDGAFRADPKMDLLLARKEYDELLAAQLTGNFRPTPEQIAGWLTMLTVQAKDKQARLVITYRAEAWLSERVDGFEAGFALFVERLQVQRLGEETGIAGYVVN